MLLVCKHTSPCNMYPCSVKSLNVIMLTADLTTAHPHCVMHPEKHMKNKAELLSAIFSQYEIL